MGQRLGSMANLTQFALQTELQNLVYLPLFQYPGYLVIDLSASFLVPLSTTVLVSSAGRSCICSKTSSGFSPQSKSEPPPLSVSHRIPATVNCLCALTVPGRLSPQGLCTGCSLACDALFKVTHLAHPSQPSDFYSIIFSARPS